ncbi:MAG: class I SAM-dependent methyltransferase [Candidatus Eisenbacteria bacterium]
MSDTAGYDESYLAQIYDHVPLHTERGDIPFFVEAARESGGAVLELGCGTGRVLIPTARAGVEIAGLDTSERMLDVCRQRLLEEPSDVRARVQLLRGDMREFGLSRTFSLITTPFRSFQHLLTVEEQMSCLRCVGRHLSGGGRLILDVFNPSLEMLVSTEVGKEVESEPKFELPDGRRVVRRHRIDARDHLNQTSHCELIYYVNHLDGRQERLVHSFHMRYLYRFEAEHLLERCGFRVEQLFADFDRSAFGSKYPGELIFVARKA